MLFQEHDNQTDDNDDIGTSEETETDSESTEDDDVADVDEDVKDTDDGDSSN